jgi:hypothetical protein
MRGVYIYYVEKKAIHVDEYDIQGLRKASQGLHSFYILTKKRDMGEVLKTFNKVETIFEEKDSHSPMVFLRSFQ